MKKYNVSLQETFLVYFSLDPKPFDVFENSIHLNELISHIIAQSNLYGSQNGPNFITNDAEMKAFLEINSIMSIDKLPSIKHYWSTDKYIDNQGQRDVIIKSRFEEILHNIQFSDNDTADSNDKGHKVKSLIDNFNEAFQNAMANFPNQSVDEQLD